MLSVTSGPVIARSCNFPWSSIGAKSFYVVACES